jgi:hypothetical protein
MRYVTGALVAVLLLAGVMGLQTAGAQSTDVNPCSGKITIPAGLAAGRTPVNAACTGPMNIVATVNGNPIGENGVWVVGVRHYPRSGDNTIRLNTTDHLYPVDVAWYAFQSS